MNQFKSAYVTILSAFVVLTGCSDDDLLPAGEITDPNAITFTAMTYGPAYQSSRSRSAEDEDMEYEPLVLTDDNDSQTLYLHTYVADHIGFDPADDVVQADTRTRGNQITTCGALSEFHKNFKVKAFRSDNAENYIEWTDAGPLSSDNSVWVTGRTEYWPSNDMLSFAAVSPASQFNQLKNLTVGNNTLTFGYTAQKGRDNLDAQAQPDLLVATSMCDKASSIDGRAPLKFNHALASVKFAVRDVLGGTIESITIAGVHSSGKCSYTYHDDTGGVFSWSDVSGNETYSQKFDYAVDDRQVDPSDDSGDIILNDRMPEKTFMMIPQQIPDEAEIIVTLTRNNVSPLPSRITVRGKIRTNRLTVWESGKEYIYTISTSKDNWVYVFNATGNHRTSDGKHDVDGNSIYVYSPSVKDFDKYGENAYFKVTSYRYRANKQTVKEILPWTASHGDGRQYRISIPEGQEGHEATRRLTAAEWINDPKGLKGAGSALPERHDLTFADHHIMTNWLGDEWMQGREPYSGNTKSKPWDLSTYGGSVSRNTANTYVIDREGWYCFPLVYGNAIKDGKTNEKAYSYKGECVDGQKYLMTFKNYEGKDIVGPNIPDAHAKSAGIVWSDVYNAISDVQLATIGSEKMVLFHANKYNLQQGNTVIALYDGNGVVVWSWQIWITEHWLNPENGKSHNFDNGAKAFDYEKVIANGRRNRGDLPVKVPAKGPSSVEAPYTYYVAPYNVGWCDSKSVDYLERPGKMAFLQYMPDGKTLSGHTAELPIMQKGEYIEYKFGNNTYYQFGRKDPSVGFVNHESEVKRNFGPKQYELGEQTKSIEHSIRNPQMLYCNGNADDWNSEHYINLWNNNTDAKYANVSTNSTVAKQCSDARFFHSLKTVYDPCPPGYMVPPSAVFKMIGTDNKGVYNNGGSDNKDIKTVNGELLDPYTFKIKTENGLKDETAIWLTSTGNRWYTPNHSVIKLPGGGNFNPQIVYLWSSNAIGSNSGSSYSLALGLDKSGGDAGNEYCICTLFIGRRSMARPVRPIREKYN